MQVADESKPLTLFLIYNVDPFLTNYSFLLLLTN